MPRFELPGPPTPHEGPLFAADADWWNNACIDPFGTSWTVYSRGYLEAARILVRRVGDTQQQQDLLVYPIIFLSRQYLELTLKYLGTTASDLLHEAPLNQKGHSLSALWLRLPGLFRRLEAEMAQEVLPESHRQEIDRLLEEFERIDRTSYAFRYPVDNNGDPALPVDLTHLNLRRFGDAMDRLAYLLEDLITATDYYYDYFGPGAGL